MTRAGDLEALERIAASFASRERFLSELTLDPPDATSDEAGPPLRDEDYLILSTIHSAKGQEWRSVFVLNCVDGCIPSDLATGSSEEIEEERRLLYVAMTRARDELTLVVPQRFYVHGQPKNGDRSVFAGRTRFIPPPLLKHFDRQTWPAAERWAAPVAAARPARRSCGAHAGDVAVKRTFAAKTGRRNRIQGASMMDRPSILRPATPIGRRNSALRKGKRTFFELARRSDLNQTDMPEQSADERRVGSKLLGKEGGGSRIADS